MRTACANCSASGRRAGREGRRGATCARWKRACALVARGNDVRVRRYFHLEAREHEDDAAATVETVRMMIERAVDDVVPLRPASMLSGGIDSTFLTALLRKRMEPVRTFSVDYEGNARHFRGTSFQPERDAPYIELAVERIGCEHTIVELKQAALAQALEEAVDARGFPGMADVDSSLLLFARKIAPQARFVLSGECGDEVFGGYPWFRDAHSLNAESFPWSGSLELRAGVLKRRVREKLNIRKYVRETLADAVARVEHTPHESADDRCLRTMQHLCFAFFMANLQERALAMCEHSHVEVLTPFADERLLQYVYNVPWEMKFMGGREKGLLREAVGTLLPESLRYRKKSPYPKTCDPEYARIVCGMLQNLLADRKSPLLHLADARALERLAASDLSPTQTPWFGQLMAGPQMLAYLWQVNVWMRDRARRDRPVSAKNAPTARPGRSASVVFLIRDYGAKVGQQHGAHIDVFRKRLHALALDEESARRPRRQGRRAC